MGKTSIEWTDESSGLLRYRDASGHVVWACEKVSPGCRGCYAEAMAHRFGKGGPFNAGVTRGLTPYLDEKEAHRLLTSRALSGKRVFVDDMTDLFGEWVSDELIAAHFGIFAARPDVTFQVLTKRAERLPQWFEWVASHRMANAGGGEDLNVTRACIYEGQRLGAQIPARADAAPWPLLNVHLGVSCEDQQRADERIPYLLDPHVLAAVKWVSEEPLLGPIDHDRWLARWENCNSCGESYPFEEAVHGGDGTSMDRCARCGAVGSMIATWGDEQTERWRSGARYQDGGPRDDEDGPPLHWIVVGGESGPGARPMHPAWARSIRDQCVAAGVPFFFKQWGAWEPFYDRERDDPCWRNVPKESDSVRRLNLAGGVGFHGEHVVYLRRVGKAGAGRLLDGRTWDEMPRTGTAP